MRSPHAVAAHAFIHVECSALRGIKHSGNERAFFATFVAERRVRLSPGFLFFHP